MEIRMANEVLKVGEFAELTAANNELFRKEVCTALNGHTTIEIDLSRTTFMDCAGLGALIALRNFARGRNGTLRLVNPTPAVRQLFEVVRARAPVRNRQRTAARSPVTRVNRTPR